MLDAIRQTTSSYTFLNVLFVLLIMIMLLIVIRIFVSKKSTTIPVLTNENTIHIFLTLKSIQLFPEDVTAKVQVVTYVNGTVFQYPTANNTQWQTIPEMSGKTITLPVADMYYIRFELNIKPTKKLEGGPLIVHGASALINAQNIQSSMSTVVLKLPISGEYQLYLLSDGSRDIALKALILYEIYTA